MTGQVSPVRISDLRISTNEESYVFHIYHTARLFVSGSMEVETSLSKPDLAVLADRPMNVIRIQDRSSGREREYPGTDKESCKRAVFSFLSEWTGQRIPWGTLIGVRPTKLVLTALTAGRSEPAIRAQLLERYLVTEEKLDLAIRVAKTEQKLLQGWQDGRIGIYLDMPFCPTKCFYCSFLSYPSANQAAMARYEEALLQDIQRTGELLKTLGLEPGYLYFGGGTPTSGSAESLRRILTAAIQTFRSASPMTEFTVEAGRPDTITPEKLSLMKELGVTRLSINPQTFCDRTLQSMGRTHTGRDIETCLDQARSLNFESINMDLILGLPGESVAEAAASIRRACALGPENITIHSLALKKGASLTQVDSQTRDRVSAMYRIVYDELARAGYEPYYLYRNKNTLGNLENVGFTRGDHASRYNIAMIEETDTIAACGASGITRVVTGAAGESGSPLLLRHNGYKDLELYLRSLNESLAAKAGVLSRARERLDLSERPDSYYND